MSDTDFRYTDYKTFDSALVESALYNENDQELLVALKDRDGDSVAYLYENVPARVFSDFKGANSAGRFYGTEVKRKYGPGENLGDAADLWVSPTNVQDVAKPEAPQSTAAVPKDLTYSRTTSSGNHLSLVASEPKKAASEGGLLRHKVTFQVGGVQKKYTLNAPDVYAAKESVEEILEMLGVEGKVTKVRVYFD